LSKYHGAGTGKRGHLQFKLASGQIRREDMGKTHIDCNKLERIVLACEHSHAKKRRLMNDLRSVGIQSYPLCYEDFQGDKLGYFQRVCEILGITISTEAIAAVVDRGAGFEKVHPDEISDFVINHEEVMNRLGHRFVRWQ
jgi:hypothetical protein